MPEIILKNVSKRFGSFAAVDNLNLVIENNSFITLLGPSGCGKTTTLRMIAGLETPTEGEITIDGKIVFSSSEGINVPPNKRDVGFLFQNYALWPHMTVRQNIIFGLQNQKWPKQEIEARLSELLKMLKIEEFVDRYPAELSGGQQQRVAIARTLAPKPKVLFMDEPLSNLDAKLRTEMRTELKRLHVDTDSTFVYVTHDQLEAMTLSTKVCLMKKGILQQYAPPLEMYSMPENLFVADFVGNPTMNFVKGKAKLDNGELLFEAGSLKLKFHSKNEFKLTSEDVTLGIRPEHIILERGKIKGKVYSTLPAGMETTVKIQIDDMMLTSVVFGEFDYKIDSDTSFSFEGEKICLFDENERRIAIGSLSEN